MAHQPEHRCRAATKTYSLLPQNRPQDNGLQAITFNISYAAASMPSAGWNDRVSSAKTYGGCGTNTHYQDSNYVGSQHVCECATMGVMNDETSSERWGL